MKLEKNIYVIMKIGTEMNQVDNEVGTGFFKTNNDNKFIFVNDIEYADHFKHYSAALWMKHKWENRKKTELDWKIIPLKITYRW